MVDTFLMLAFQQFYGASIIIINMQNLLHQELPGLPSKLQSLHLISGRQMQELRLVMTILTQHSNWAGSKPPTTLPNFMEWKNTLYAKIWLVLYLIPIHIDLTYSFITVLRDRVLILKNSTVKPNKLLRGHTT